MKAKVPGGHDSTGVKAMDFTLPAGDYAFEIGKAEIKESEKSPCNGHIFEMVVVDGPDDPKTGKTTQGRKFIRRIYVLEPEHPSYDPSNTQNTDEIADLCAAAGVVIDDDDSYETDDFGGQVVRARLGIKQGKGEDGSPRPENTIRQQKTEDGVVHLWLPDDGKPVASKSPKSTPKTAAKKGSPKKR